MAVSVVLLVASVLVGQAVYSSIPPKFIKAAYGVQKALYAKKFGYSLVPIPTHIQRQVRPPKSLPIVGQTPAIASRKGRGYSYYRPRGPPRRRKRPSIKRRRPPSSYGVPVYATKYKNYVPYRRPYSHYGRYKKRRPYRPHTRRPYTYVDVHHEIDDYEQEVPEYYDDYDPGDRGEYYVDIPSKRLPLEYDKNFLSRHADLYNGGFNSGPPRKRPDAVGEHSFHRVRSRIQYQESKGDTQEKEDNNSQEVLWPGEVTNANLQENVWSDQTGEQSHNYNLRDLSSDDKSRRTTWQEEFARIASPPNFQDPSHQEWQNHPIPPRLDNQWDTYQPPSAPQRAPIPTSIPEVRGWTTSLRPKPLTAAVAAPSRPVVPREPEPPNHRPIYNWDPVSKTYQEAIHDSRPRYQAHYSEAEFSYRDAVDRRSAQSHRGQRSGEPDIGFGEGMELVDDGVAGWKVD